jgi:hypothetical protein
VSAFGTIPTGEIAQKSSNLEGDNDIIPEQKGTRASPRTVLVELFTQWNCDPYCAYANPALNELLDVFDQTQMIMIATHASWPLPNDDPFYLDNEPDADARIAYYGVGGVPTTIFDGEEVSVAGDANTRYPLYKNEVNTRLSVVSPISIDIEGYYTATQGYVNVTVTATGSIPLGTNKIKFVVTEDNRYAPGGNGEVRHRTVMRDMLASEDLPALTMGGQYSVSRDFPIESWWSKPNLAIVAYVQHEHNGETDDKIVLNSAQYDYIPQTILVVDDDESTNPLGMEDDYQEILCYANIAFDSLVLNEVGSPSGAALENYEDVIWVTGSTSSSTLTTADQDALKYYLDDTTGSLFLCGENIGSDIGGTSFYSDYLHSTFIQANTGDRYITGIPMDPISDNYVGSDLTILDTSPSEINPISPATHTFMYTMTGLGAAVKVDHDMDSRVVYFAFLFFESAESENNKRSVMQKVLFWLNTPPSVITLVEGYNFISIPAIQMDSSLDSVFDSLSGKYDCVQRYDITDPSDSWKHWNEGKPGAMNDLSMIEHNMGFWIRVTDPGETLFYYNGTAPMFNEEVFLYTGWNMVGYPSKTDRDRDSALNNINFGTDVDAVWTFDAQSGQWTSLGSSDLMERGRGYLIHSLVDKIWTVPI